MPEIRCLTESDLEFANSVREIAGWNQTLTDWRRFIGLEPEGCFLAEIDGQPAGTATTTCFGTDLAWIGMVLVHPDFRRRGIGTALLEHCIQHLRKTRGVRCVKLDATPEGQPLYEKLGFEPEWGLKRWVWKGQRDRETGGWRDGAKLMRRHFDLDLEVFGANRQRLLESFQETGLKAMALDRGFGMARAGSRASYIGPVTAANTATGLEILRELIVTAEPGPEGLIFLDLPDPNEAAIRIVSDAGFEPVRELTRMFLGSNSSPGDPLRMFGISEPGLG